MGRERKPKLGIIAASALMGGFLPAGLGPRGPQLVRPHKPVDQAALSQAQDAAADKRQRRKARNVINAKRMGLL